MGDQKIKVYQRVRYLVSLGISSPTIILEEIPEIKQWRTAKKYIDQAIEEITLHETDTAIERSHMIESLKELRSNLALKISKTAHLNQYIGGIKQLLSINAQLIELKGLKIMKDEKKQSWEEYIRDAEVSLDLLQASA
ncbi:MAG: hypothetical protein ACK4NC_01770 [Candidatus Gracilibacteria bacterium]